VRRHPPVERLHRRGRGHHIQPTLGHLDRLHQPGQIRLRAPPRLTRRQTVHRGEQRGHPHARRRVIEGLVDTVRGHAAGIAERCRERVHASIIIEHVFEC
jgi:hypothetical protein